MKVFNKFSGNIMDHAIENNKTIVIPTMQPSLRNLVTAILVMKYFSALFQQRSLFSFQSYPGYCHFIDQHYNV